MRPCFFLTPDTWNLSMVYSRIDENITLIRNEPKYLTLRTFFFWLAAMSALPFKAGLMELNGRG